MCGHKRDVTMMRNGVVLIRAALFGKELPKEVIEAICKIEYHLDNEIDELEGWECLACEMSNKDYFDHLVELVE